MMQNTESNAFDQRVVWSFWTTDEPLTENRALAVDRMRQNLGVELCLLTGDEVYDYQLPGEPFHAGYRHLSATHRADYLRSYFMVHYGGGYCDVKPVDASWLPAFEALAEAEEKSCIGYQEAGPWDMALPPEFEHLRTSYERSIGNGAYIFNPGSAMARDWLEKTWDKMEDIATRLAECPGTYHPRATADGAWDAPEIHPRGYPLRWAELLGEIFHPVSGKHFGSIMPGLPRPVLLDYR